MSNQLLHLDSSILGDHSVTRLLSATVVARLLLAQPDLKVAYRDLAASPIPHLTGAELQSNLALGNAVLEEFLAADIVVIGVAFYNFSISSQLKAWVDRIAVAGRTFRYGENGVEGLAGGKRVILAIARGGFYGEGQPTQAFEHAESYLRGVFAFLGIPQVEVIAAEGVAIGQQQRQAAIARAQGQIDAIAA